MLSVNQDHSSRLLHWIVMGLVLLLLGIILHFTNGKDQIKASEHPQFLFLSFLINPASLAAAIPLNKQLYTFSYVCVTSGAAALVFSAFYILVSHCTKVYYSYTGYIYTVKVVRLENIITLIPCAG